MLDSLLTLTTASVYWMLGSIVLCVLLDRAVSALTGLAITIFLVIAVGIVGALLVAGTYTIIKSLRHRPQAQ